MTYLIFFLSSLVQSLGGFGGGLFAVPLLTLLYEPRFIVPSFSLVSFLLNFVVLLEVRNRIEWNKVTVISLSSFIGVPAGTLALKFLDQNLIRLLIAVVTLILGMFFLAGFRPPVRENKPTLITAGLASGFLNGAAAMGGPPLIFLMMALGLRKDEFRATLAGCFAFSGTLGIILYFTNGLFNVPNLKISLFAFLPALIGTLLGIMIKNLLPEEKFGRIIVLVIILIGVLGTFRALSLLTG